MIWDGVFDEKTPSQKDLTLDRCMGYDKINKN